MTRPPCMPLEVRCADCGAPPGERCTWEQDGKPTFRRPHAARVTRAREVSTRLSRATQQHSR